MHDSINQIRQNLLHKRSEFIKSPSFPAEFEHFLFHLGYFLQKKGGSFKSLAFCWPYRDELDLRMRLLEWQKERPDRLLLLPKVKSDKRLSFYTWSASTPLIRNSYGIDEPDPMAKGVIEKIPDCILIPCVGWSIQQNQCWRLGYGGGYFDRTLLDLKKTGHRFQSVGIGFDWQQINEAWLPKEHDQPLDLILTNSGLKNG